MKKDKNAKRLTKSYDKLCRITWKITDAMDENADIKQVKDGFAAVKEGVNIGQLLEKRDCGNEIRVLFEGDTEDMSG